MKKTLLAGIAFVVVLGCSSESQQEYQQAGQNLGQAAKATGKAVATDAQVAAEATKNAAEAAKDTVQKHDVGTQKTTTVEKDGKTVTTTTTTH